jgi:phosphoribosylformylglycinamidine synthase
MTEEVYSKPVASFAVDATPAPTITVPVLEQGRAALEKINKVGCACFESVAAAASVL